MEGCGPIPDIRGIGDGHVGNVGGDKEGRGEGEGPVCITEVLHITICKEDKMKRNYSVIFAKA